MELIMADELQVEIVDSQLQNAWNLEQKCSDLRCFRCLVIVYCFSLCNCYYEVVIH